MERGDARMVSVWIFRADDGRTGKERILAAVRLAGHAGDEEKAVEDAAETPAWRVGRTERGKPYFPEQPGIHFSISHSGELWVCALGESPLGVDVQKCVKKRGESDREAAGRFGRMARRFFHPREADWVERDPGQRFFRIWAAKESYVKYTGEGIGAGFDLFCTVPPPETEEREAAGAESQTVRREGWDGKVQMPFEAGRDAERWEAAGPDWAEEHWKASGSWFYARKLPGGYELCVCSGPQKEFIQIRYFDEISGNNGHKCE